MFDQNPDLEPWPVPKNKNWFKSEFCSNIDYFLELYWKNKYENRKSSLNKFLGIPKAVQNRSKQSLKVPELGATLAWSCWIFRKFQDLDQILKISMFFNQNFRFSGNLHGKYFERKIFRKIFWIPKNIFFFGVEKKVGI